MPDDSIYWIYILECSNGSFYTGYTGNIIKRYSQHLKGSAKYTRSFRPVRIAGLWKINGTRGNAMMVEAFIKKKTKKSKIELLQKPSLLKKEILLTRGMDLNISKSKIPDL